MDWELIIDSLMDLVKDEETRTEIYQKLLEATDDVDVEELQQDHEGVDDAFDNALSLYEDPFATDDEDEEDEDLGDNDYESDDDNGWEEESDEQ